MRINSRPDWYLDVSTLSYVRGHEREEGKERHEEGVWRISCAILVRGQPYYYSLFCLWSAVWTRVPLGFIILRKRHGTSRLVIQELANVAHHLLLTEVSRNVHTDNACKLSLIGLMRMYRVWMASANYAARGLAANARINVTFMCYFHLAMEVALAHFRARNELRAPWTRG